MEIKIEKRLLLHELVRMSKIISSSNSLMSLKGIMLIVDKNEITFLGSNSNLSLKSVVKISDKISVIKTGKTLIPAKVFNDVIKKQDLGIINLKSDDHELTITSNNSVTKINLYDADNFPIIEFDILGEEIKINSEIFSSINRKISFAASEHDQRIILNGINISTRDNEIVAVATNSYRLGVLIRKINIKEDINITFFAKILKDIIPYNKQMEMTMVVDEDKVNISYDHLTYQLRLIDSTYPKIEQLIPDKFIAEYDINIINFINLIEKVTAVSGQNSAPIKITKNHKNIIIESKQTQTGGSLIKVSNDDWKGDDLEITFDSKFMIQALKAFDIPNIKINFAGQFKAIVISSEKEPSLTQVVLPHRTY